ncbi:MAG: twin-arginine translocase subunit TatC [Gemmatimonadetes bacterium]|uniref:Sec-independent protein translocase protein TatC n=1 Tax=Candidatus Kutchimonas denitrificans TaxID=3056748 RepID=A0AAE4Z512_9BACT|nr:twin-arginine translocase subunit TatC [Gemmatimonadota bacterium]NIR73914.1 twin-arginine translocase subunit TatC [Candidatus Kutchimonas denitrificans]NIR99720.1 twin-arginine translocase subunit TatC [Gemmatimonadota bacterium]NIT65305.1 twin-arginine translocase subunit TatC [Gemmatimonadota bacterium]NIW73754.1 twin-arginine translocase subunit TatC [Gemmatimonadota bacterium]
MRWLLTGPQITAWLGSLAWGRIGLTSALVALYFLGFYIAARGPGQRAPRARGTGEMPFLEHLEELRWRLIWVGISVLILSVAGFFLVTELDVIGLLKRPIEPLVPDGQLLFTSPTEPMTVTLKLSFVVGIVLGVPIIVYHTWGFMSPALLQREREVAIPAVIGGFLLFLLGVAMAYFLVLPLGLRFLLGFQTQALNPIITIGEYLKFATRLILAFGIIFELPLVSVLLAMLGLITADTLKRYRRHAIVGVAALSAILTPADVGTMLMMMAPLVLLYEVSILLVAVMDRRRVAYTSRESGSE